jgi:hypothetical protein
MTAVGEPVEVPQRDAVIVRTGCDGGVLVLALAPEVGYGRAVEVADNLHKASGLKVIAVVDVAAVKAWHPHDAPRELREAMAETRRFRERLTAEADRLDTEAAKDDGTREGTRDGISRLLLERHAEWCRAQAATLRGIGGIR